jgi:glycosidase
MNSRRFALLATSPALAVLVLLASCSQPADHVDPRPDRGWYTGQVLYQITIAEFSEAGTFDGAIPHLGELRDLGISVVVLNPIHPAGGAVADSVPAHPYAVRDHLAVDPALGDVAAFERFVEAAHASGLRVLLDMVLNHGATDHVAAAEHPDWFTRDDQGQPVRKVAAWRTVADLDQQHPDVQDYLDLVLATWIERGVDGFRCLHANLQDGEFWTATLAAARQSHPGLYVVADSRDPRHLDEGFDAILRPDYLEASAFAHMDDFGQRGLEGDLWFAVVDTVLQTTGRGMNFLEDRFSRRAVESFPWPKGAGYVAALLTLPGHPLLYNGQEWGCAQPPRLFDAVPLDRDTRDQRWEPLYRDLLALRAASVAIRTGDARRLISPDRGLLAFTREANDELVLVLANCSDHRPEVTLPPALASRQWQRWQGDGFATQPVSLGPLVAVDPCQWQAWRAVP